MEDICGNENDFIIEDEVGEDMEAEEQVNPLAERSQVLVEENTIKKRSLEEEEEVANIEDVAENSKRQKLLNENESIQEDSEQIHVVEEMCKTNQLEAQSVQSLSSSACQLDEDSTFNRDDKVNDNLETAELGNDLPLSKSPSNKDSSPPNDNKSVGSTGINEEKVTGESSEQSSQVSPAEPSLIASAPNRKYIPGKPFILYVQNPDLVVYTSEKRGLHKWFECLLCKMSEMTSNDLLLHVRNQNHLLNLMELEAPQLYLEFKDKTNNESTMLLQMEEVERASQDSKIVSCNFANFNILKFNIQTKILHQKLKVSQPRLDFPYISKAPAKFQVQKKKFCDLKVLMVGDSRVLHLKWKSPSFSCNLLQQSELKDIEAFIGDGDKLKSIDVLIILPLISDLIKLEPSNKNVEVIKMANICELSYKISSLNTKWRSMNKNLAISWLLPQSPDFERLRKGTTNSSSNLKNSSEVCWFTNKVEVCSEYLKYFSDLTSFRLLDFSFLPEEEKIIRLNGAIPLIDSTVNGFHPSKNILRRFLNELNHHLMAEDLVSPPQGSNKWNLSKRNLFPEAFVPNQCYDEMHSNDVLQFVEKKLMTSWEYFSGEASRLLAYDTFHPFYLARKAINANTFTAESHICLTNEESKLLSDEISNFKVENQVLMYKAKTLIPSIKAEAICLLFLKCFGNIHSSIYIQILRRDFHFIEQQLKDAYLKVLKIHPGHAYVGHTFVKHTRKVKEMYLKWVQKRPKKVSPPIVPVKLENPETPTTAADDKECDERPNSSTQSTTEKEIAPDNSIAPVEKQTPAIESESAPGAGAQAQSPPSPEHVDQETVENQDQTTHTEKDPLSGFNEGTAIAEPLYEESSSEAPVVDPMVLDNAAIVEIPIEKGAEPQVITLDSDEENVTKETCLESTTPPDRIVLLCSPGNAYMNTFCQNKPYVTIREGPLNPKDWTVENVVREEDKKTNTLYIFVLDLTLFSESALKTNHRCRQSLCARPLQVYNLKELSYHDTILQIANAINAVRQLNIESGGKFKAILTPFQFCSFIFYKEIDLYHDAAHQRPMMPLVISNPICTTLSNIFLCVRYLRDQVDSITNDYDPSFKDSYVRYMIKYKQPFQAVMERELLAVFGKKKYLPHSFEPENDWMSVVAQLISSHTSVQFEYSMIEPLESRSTSAEEDQEEVKGSEELPLQKNESLNFDRALTTERAPTVIVVGKTYLHKGLNLGPHTEFMNFNVSHICEADAAVILSRQITSSTKITWLFLPDFTMLGKISQLIPSCQKFMCKSPLSIIGLKNGKTNGSKKYSKMSDEDLVKERVTSLFSAAEKVLSSSGPGSCVMVCPLFPSRVFFESPRDSDEEHGRLHEVQQSFPFANILKGSTYGWKNSLRLMQTLINDKAFELATRQGIDENLCQKLFGIDDVIRGADSIEDLRANSEESGQDIELWTESIHVLVSYCEKDISYGCRKAALKGASTAVRRPKPVAAIHDNEMSVEDVRPGNDKEISVEAAPIDSLEKNDINEISVIEDKEAEPLRSSLSKEDEERLREDLDVKYDIYEEIPEFHADYLSHYDYFNDQVLLNKNNLSEREIEQRWVSDWKDLLRVLKDKEWKEWLVNPPKKEDPTPVFSKDLAPHRPNKETDLLKRLDGILRTVEVNLKSLGNHINDRVKPLINRYRNCKDEPEGVECVQLFQDGKNRDAIEDLIDVLRKKKKEYYSNLIEDLIIFLDFLKTVSSASVVNAEAIALSTMGKDFVFLQDMIQAAFLAEDGGRSSITGSEKHIIEAKVNCHHYFMK